MLVQDTSAQDRLRWRKVVENTRQIAADSIAHQKWQVDKTQKSETGRGILDPRQTEHQLGRPLMPQILMARLKRMNPSLMFLKNSLGNWSVVYPIKERTPDGGEKEVLRMAAWFENSVVPEFDIQHPVYDKVWDAEKRDFQATLKTVRPTPGWRQILSRLLKLKLATLSGIRENFGYDSQRKSWLDTVRLYGG